MKGANTSRACRRLLCKCSCSVEAQYTYMTCSYTCIHPSKHSSFPSFLWLTAILFSALFCLSAWGSSLCHPHLRSPASFTLSTSMSGSYDESAAPDEAMDSFWEVWAYSLFNALSMLVLCFCQRECVMSVKPTEATLCFMSESARKTTTASFFHWAGFSEGFHHLLRSSKPLILWIFSVRAALLSCEGLHFKLVVPSPQHTHLTSELSAYTSGYSGLRGFISNEIARETPLFFYSFISQMNITII